MQLILFSCSGGDENMDGYNVDAQVCISYKNVHGQDLLDNSTENYYNIKNMKLFYLIDNEPVEVIIEKFHTDGIYEDDIGLAFGKFLVTHTYPHQILLRKL